MKIILYASIPYCVLDLWTYKLLTHTFVRRILITYRRTSTWWQFIRFWQYTFGQF